MRTRTRVARILLIAAPLGLAIAARAAKPPPPPPPEYHLVALGDVPPWPEGHPTNAYDVAAGVAVGQITYLMDQCVANGYGQERAAIFSPLAANTPSPLFPSFVDDPGPEPGHSRAMGISRDGTLVVGRWLAADQPDPCALGVSTGVAWTFDGFTWNRELVEPLSAAVVAAEWVNSTAIAVGNSGGPTAWRRNFAGSWSREPMQAAGGSYGIDIQDDGLVVSASASVWDCSTTPCGAPQALPSGNLVAPGQATDINDAGDVVGRGQPNGSYSRAIIWRRTLSGWANPAALPDFGFGGGWAAATEVVNGVLTVVGGAVKDRKGNTTIVR